MKQSVGNVLIPASAHLSSVGMISAARLPTAPEAALRESADTGRESWLVDSVREGGACVSVCRCSVCDLLSTAAGPEHISALQSSLSACLAHISASAAHTHTESFTFTVTESLCSDVRDQCGTSLSFRSVSYLSLRFLYSNCHFSAFMASAECLALISWAWGTQTSISHSSERTATESSWCFEFTSVNPDCVHVKTLQHEVHEDSELASKHSGLIGGSETKLIEFMIYEHLFAA